MIADQLRRQNIEVVTTQELEVLGNTDLNHLQRGAKMNCMLCTQDDDYLKLAAEGIEHAGIVYGRITKHGIGDWVKGLEKLHMTCTPDEMKNHVEYL